MDIRPQMIIIFTLLLSAALHVNADQLEEQVTASMPQLMKLYQHLHTHPEHSGAEDFGRYYRADKRIKCLIFWVGGVPQKRWDKAQ